MEAIKKMDILNNIFNTRTINEMKLQGETIQLRKEVGYYLYIDRDCCLNVEVTVGENDADKYSMNVAPIVTQTFLKYERAVSSRFTSRANPVSNVFKFKSLETIQQNFMPAPV